MCKKRYRELNSVLFIRNSPDSLICYLHYSLMCLPAFSTDGTSLWGRVCVSVCEVPPKMRLCWVRKSELGRGYVEVTLDSCHCRILADSSVYESNIYCSSYKSCIRGSSLYIWVLEWALVILWHNSAICLWILVMSTCSDPFLDIFTLFFFLSITSADSTLCVSPC